MIPIVVCTVGCKSLAVFEKSVEVYSPDTKIIVHRSDKKTFGEAYNEALVSAFKEYDEVIIANDDVVITPTTIPYLLQDVNKLKSVSQKLGFVAAMADNTRIAQTIRYDFLNAGKLVMCKWEHEQVVKQVPVIAPIFAWLSKDAFNTVQFPPLTWWSDDVMCEDLNEAGFKHYVSRAYVHHVGSQTIGENIKELQKEALPWVLKNRSYFSDMWFESKDIKRREIDDSL